MEEFIVRKQVTVRAPMRHVWHALTDSELTQKYFFGCKVYSNWIVDSPITFKRKIFLFFPMVLTGKILKINRGTMLQYSFNNSRSKTESIVTIELYEDTGQTVVSITDDVGKEEGVEDRFERSLKGWDKILNGLKNVVEDKLREG